MVNGFDRYFEGSVHIRLFVHGGASKMKLFRMAVMTWDELCVNMNGLPYEESCLLDVSIIVRKVLECIFICIVPYVLNVLFLVLWSQMIEEKINTCLTLNQGWRGGREM